MPNEVTTVSTLFSWALEKAQTAKKRKEAHSKYLIWLPGKV